MRLLASMLLLLALASVAGAGPRRHETADQEVERLAGEAVEAYKAGDFQKSVELLTRAYAIHPLAPLLYNLAKAYDKLDDIDDACATWKKYVASPDADPRLAKKAQEKVAGCEAARSAMAAPSTVPVPIWGAKVEAPAGPSPEELRRRDEEARRKRQRAWLGAGIGVAALGVGALAAGVGLWASASSLHDQFASSLDEDKKRGLRDDAQARGVASTAMYCVGAALVGASLPLLYLGLRHEREPQRISLAPWVGPGVAGGAAWWRF